MNTYYAKLMKVVEIAKLYAEWNDEEDELVTDFTPDGLRSLATLREFLDGFDKLKYYQPPIEQTRAVAAFLLTVWEPSLDDELSDFMSYIGPMDERIADDEIDHAVESVRRSLDETNALMYFTQSEFLYR